MKKLMILSLLALAACQAHRGMYIADSLDRFGTDVGGKPTYAADGELDFPDQDPSEKAKKVMLAACPQGSPQLVSNKAYPVKAGTETYHMYLTVFTCDDPIPGVD